MIGAIGALDLGGKAVDLSDLSKMPAAGAAGMTAPAGASFADVLNQVAGSTFDKLGNAETMSIRALQGDVQTREVVDAVMSAEQSLQTAIAIRDKIVTAYLDLSRMAI